MKTLVCIAETQSICFAFHGKTGGGRGGTDYLCPEMGLRGHTPGSPSPLYIQREGDFPRLGALSATPSCHPQLLTFGVPLLPLVTEVNKANCYGLPQSGLYLFRRGWGWGEGAASSLGQDPTCFLSLIMSGAQTPTAAAT